VSSPASAAAAFAAHRAFVQGGAVLANPVPASDELDRGLHDRVLASGLAMVADRGIKGKDVTPALLEHFHRATGGASLLTNVALVLSNASLAARVAVELSRL